MAPNIVDPSKIMKTKKNSGTKFWAICVVALVNIGLSKSGIAADKVDTEDSRYPKGSSEAYKKRISAIKREIANIKSQEWAGEYRYGYGISANADFFIAPASGFAYRVDGCFGLYERNYGSVDWRANEIMLNFDLPNDRKHFGLSANIVPVLWGKRHYLIPESELIDFGNAINSGNEPCIDYCARFLLKVGDEKRTVNGEPNIPESFRRYLLDKPVYSKILSIGQVQIELDKFDPNYQTKKTELTLNVGRNEHVFPGMAFHVVRPQGAFETVYVTVVGENQSQAVVVQYGENIEDPKIDWMLSSKGRN